MSKLFAMTALALWLVVTSVAAARAEEPSFGRSVAVGALVGGAAGAAGGAVWGERSGDGNDALIGAAALGAFGAAAGAITGAAITPLPRQSGWKQYAQAAAVGIAVSGLTFWTIGRWNGNVGPWFPGDFRNFGIGHGAVTALVTVRLRE